MSLPDPLGESKSGYWMVPRGVPVLWVPFRGKPRKGESPFLTFEDGGQMILYVGRGEFHHAPNEFERALADRGYHGLWIAPLSGFPDDRSVWFHPKRVEPWEV